MLWNKSWMDSRWRFLTGLGLLMFLAVGTVVEYPTVAKLMPMAGTIDTSGPLGRLIKDALEIQRDYRGFVWYQWFRQNLVQLWALFAVLLGSGGLASTASGRPALFTLSLPITRNRLLGVRAATGLAELMVLAVIPSLLIPALSPSIGQSYSVADTLVHGACLFIAGASLFSLALLLSTVFHDLWRPLLIACAAAIVVAVGEEVFRELAPIGIFRVMTAESYFRSGQLPWLGLAVSAALSAAMLYAAALNFNRQDY
jgi:ABC-type transport system involved in multi-copper enzyme maturation permease subunit